MCFLCGGLRFREQVILHDTDKLNFADQMTDLQQHGDTNERMPTQLERDESTFAGKINTIPALTAFYTGRRCLPSSDLLQ